MEPKSTVSFLFSLHFWNFSVDNTNVPTSETTFLSFQFQILSFSFSSCIFSRQNVVFYIFQHIFSAIFTFFILIQFVWPLFSHSFYSECWLFEFWSIHLNNLKQVALAKRFNFQLCLLNYMKKKACKAFTSLPVPKKLFLSNVLLSIMDI